MNARVIAGNEIVRCSQCPFYRLEGVDVECFHTMRTVSSTNQTPDIPDWCPLEKPLQKIPEKVVDALNELSKPDVFFIDADVRKIAWSAVGQLKDAESLLMEFLVDQETLADGIRNEALVEKAKKYFGIKE